ncbi:MAG TPA: MFS transporter, partial [Spirochaetia bacterium]|nr:MFS transporter [Spirochaetia bacterium]
LIILLGMMVLPRIPTHAKPRLDIPGMVLIVAGAFSVLLGLSRGQSVGWHTLSIVATLTVGVFALIIFILWELTTDHPIIDLRVFKGNPVLAASFAGTFMVTIALYAGIFLVPIFTQQIMGFTPFQTGLLMAPAAIVMGIFSPISGRLFDRFGAVPLVLAGIVITSVTTFQLSHLGLDTSYHTLQIWYMERSAGFALFMLPMTAIGLNTVPRHLMNRVTSLNSLVRQLSGSLGIAYITYLYNRQQLVYGAMYGEKITATSPPVSGFIHGVSGYLLSHSLLGSAFIRPLALAALQRAVANQATAMAIDYTMIFAAIIIICVLPVVFFLRRPKNVPAGPAGPQGAGPGPPGNTTPPGQSAPAAR